MPFQYPKLKAPFVIELSNIRWAAKGDGLLACDGSSLKSFGHPTMEVPTPRKTGVNALGQIAGPD
jgi:hypothetical protein